MRSLITLMYNKVHMEGPLARSNVLSTEANWIKDETGRTSSSTTVNPKFLSLVHPGDLFLDVGSGSGKASRRLDTLGAKTVAFDPNHRELILGKEQSPSTSFIQAVGEKPPFADSVFDGAVMLGVLGAVGKLTREQILAETARCLKPKALIYIAEFALISDPGLKTYATNKKMGRCLCSG